jgi:CO/xanthine dehydrogenase Mo-binding subunit
MLDEPGDVHRDDGDAAALLAGASRRLTAHYAAPFQAHATLEPMCCTAHVHDGICEIWVPTQSPSDAADRVLATAFSKPAQYLQKAERRLTGELGSVAVHRTEVGGGFGRRRHNDYVDKAVAVAAEVGAPVKLVWPRAEDLQHDFYRPLTVHRLEAVVRDGRIEAWRHDLAGPDVRSGGAASLPYAIPNVRVECRPANVGVPVGSWRSVEHSYNAFATECFFDELAAAVGADPVELRLRLLAHEPRLQGVIRAAAERAGWGQARAPGRFLGVAAHACFGSYAAQIAEVSIDSSGVRVHRVVCALDCGIVVNPRIVTAQIEGSVIFGLTSTLKGAITLAGGRVEQSNFHDFPLIRCNEAPETDVVLVASGEPPGGVGEPAVPPVAPAVANAVRAATGRPVRSLPIRI